MNISPVQKNDPQIKEFEHNEWQFADIEHYGENHKYSRKTYKFVARDTNQKILGSIELFIEPNIALVEALLVDHQLKRQGIGRKLLEHAEQFALQQKCSKIFLETNEGWVAEKFYKKMGYEVTGTHKNHVCGQNTLIFTKFF